MENGEVEQFKLWPSLTDRRVFVSTIAPSADLDVIAPRPVDEDGFVRRAVAAHAYFKSQIEAHVRPQGAFDEGRLELLFEALKEGLAIVSIELERGDDPQTIFETLNSRGVELTPGDLMRNFIFQRAKGMGQSEGSLIVDKLYEKHWLPLDRAFWSQVDGRGRQSRPRLDWMLTDHLSMHVGDLVSVETLFEKYRRWILNDRPFDSVVIELESISATALVEKRLFEQKKSDPLGAFGRFANAFDVSTAMPLVVYLATTVTDGDELQRGLDVLESYILRRDICGLTTKNYNRLFVGLIDRLRAVEGGRIDALITDLSARQPDIDRWPDDNEWGRGWLGRGQYKSARQPRLRYLFEAIETAKRSALNEDIEIKSALTVEHIMPQRWRESWPIALSGDLRDEEDTQRFTREIERDAAIDRLGNLTLLTGALNSSISNGPYSVKMPAVRAHSSLALNRELNIYDQWNELMIAQRGAVLFQIARRLWQAPLPKEGSNASSLAGHQFVQRLGLPPEGTLCRFIYSGKPYSGIIEDGQIVVEGVTGRFKSFSAASWGVTKTNRNGWNDWHVLAGGNWTLADEWRKAPLSSGLSPEAVEREPAGLADKSP